MSRAEKLQSLRREIAELETEISDEKAINKQLWADNYKRLLEESINVSTPEYDGGKRSRGDVVARKLCCLYMKREGTLTFREIAQVIGLKSHRTSLYHAREAESMLDPRFGDRDFKIIHARAIELGIGHD